MIDRPRLKGFLTIFPISESVWGLRGGFDELWRIKLQNERAIAAFSAALPYLTGSHTREEVLNHLAAAGHERTEVTQLLDRLEDSRLLEEAIDFDFTPAELERYDSQISFFARYTAESGAKYQARLRSTPIGLVAEGRLGSTLRRQLEEAGYGRVVELTATAGRTNGREQPAESRTFAWPTGSDTAPPATFIVTQERDDPALLEAFDAFAREHGIAWLLVRALESQSGWIGPFFIPGETSTYFDFDARLRGNLSFFSERQAFENHLREQRRPSAPCGGLHALLDVIGGIAVVELTKYVTEITVPQLAGRFLTVNLNSWDCDLHEVLRVPRLGLHPDAQPRLFPWKEIPYDQIDAHREEEIHTRRS